MMENFYIPPHPIFDSHNEVDQADYRPVLEGSHAHVLNMRPPHFAEIPTSFHNSDLTPLPMQINAFDHRSMQYVNNHFQNSTTPILMIPQQNSSGQYVLAPDRSQKENGTQEKNRNSPNQMTASIEASAVPIVDLKPMQSPKVENFQSKDTLEAAKKDKSAVSKQENGNTETNGNDDTESDREADKVKSNFNNSFSFEESSDLEEPDSLVKINKPYLKTCIRCKAMFTNLTDKGVLSSTDQDFTCQSCQESTSVKANDLVFKVSFGEKSKFLNFGEVKGKNFHIKLNGLDKKVNNLTLEVTVGKEVKQIDIPHEDLANGDLSIDCQDEKSASQTIIPPNVKQFPCSDCGESFLDTQSLADHKLTHPGLKPWVCLECGKEFKFKNLMIRHQLSHTNIKDFACTDCGRKFRTKANLKRHQTTAHEKQKSEKKDSSSQKERTNEGDLEPDEELSADDDSEPLMDDNAELIEEKYLEVIASRPKSNNINKFRPKVKYHCKICNKGFGNKGKWKRHELYHFQLRMPVCEQCGKSFVDKDYLMEHLRITHEDIFPDYICKECGLEFPFKDELQHHILAHGNTEEPISTNTDLINVPPNEDGQFQCPECDKSFRSNYILQRHYMTHNRSTCMCQECGKFYSCRYNLVQHMMIHENKDNYICDQCGEAFKVKQYLSRHMIKHREQKTWACNICDLKFYRQGNLRHHMKQHVENKPFQCQHCPKSFVRARTLEEHNLLSHSEDRPYQCTICGRGFALERMLKPHMKIHSGFKEHKCEQCGKLFTYKSNLNQHMMIHSGEKPFICQFCGKGFARNKYLNDHMRTHNINTSSASF